MISEIYERRSIRKFLDIPIPQKDMEEILESALWAPSSKNRQPWRFIVVQGDAKGQMLEAFWRGIEREEEDPLLPQSHPYLLGARYTTKVLEEAPVVVFVLNGLGEDLKKELTLEERVSEICNVQSIGACIQNMLLCAWEKGIGSLWVCDIFFAYKEILAWLGEEGELAAAVAFGYAAQSPGPRPRKTLEEAVKWRR